MGEGLFDRLVREDGYNCRTYAPVGGHRDLLAYLVRRLLENGANSSFVHQLADQSISEDELLADPVEKIMAVGGTRHPAIAVPADLFQPERVNSNGLDLDDAVILKETAAKIAMPLKLDDDARINPTDAVTAALAAFPAWSGTPVEARADCLDRLADLLEENRSRLMAIALQEARKTIPDALSEVREAIDFCRYYAARARTDLVPIELPGPRRPGRVDRDCPVEFSAGDFLRPGCRRLGCWQHGGRQTSAADSRHRQVRSGTGA
jgi:RHH-type transcriptional regulator, proline utilization regulon repressor / proline dehydrogenase / delta 1-pyrroline-5-carboxylate dehydrogenase